MEVPTDALFQIIGQYEVAQRVLNKLIEQLQQQVKDLQAKLEEKK